jgi:hypothetical protein
LTGLVGDAWLLDRVEFADLGVGKWWLFVLVFVVGRRHGAADFRGVVRVLRESGVAQIASEYRFFEITVSGRKIIVLISVLCLIIFCYGLCVANMRLVDIRMRYCGLKIDIDGCVLIIDESFELNLLFGEALLWGDESGGNLGLFGDGAWRWSESGVGVSGDEVGSLGLLVIEYSWGFEVVEDDWRVLVGESRVFPENGRLLWRQVLPDVSLVVIQHILPNNIDILTNRNKIIMQMPILNNILGRNKRQGSPAINIAVNSIPTIIYIVVVDYYRLFVLTDYRLFVGTHYRLLVGCEYRWLSVLGVGVVLLWDWYEALPHPSVVYYLALVAACYADSSWGWGCFAAHWTLLSSPLLYSWVVSWYYARLQLRVWGDYG